MLLDRLPAVDGGSAADWITHARKLIIEHAAPQDALPRPNYRLNTGTNKGADKQATIAAAAGLDTPNGSAPADRLAIQIHSSTIHKAKGSEADAVLLALPGPQAVEELLAHWARMSTEDSVVLRVHYVALTRARRFVGLTYPYTCHDAIVKHFDDRTISYRIAPGCETMPRSRKKPNERDAGMDAIPGL
jgi:DNA helicase II / ATP-dependent DNA helicase PcrA